MTVIDVPSRTYQAGDSSFGPINASKLDGDRGLRLTITPRSQDYAAGKTIAILMEQDRGDGTGWHERYRSAGTFDSTMQGQAVSGSLPFEFIDGPLLEGQLRLTVTLGGGNMQASARVETLNPPQTTAQQQAMNPFVYENANDGQASSASAMTLTYTPPANLVTGNLGMSVCGWASTSTATTVWTLANNSAPAVTIGIGTGTTQRVELRYNENLVGGAANATNIQFSANTAYSIEYSEFSGARASGAYLGGGTFNSSASGTTSRTNAYTPGQAPVLLVAFCNLSGGPATDLTAGDDNQGHSMTMAPTNVGRRQGLIYLEEATSAAFSPQFNWTTSLNNVSGAIAFLPLAVLPIGRPNVVGQAIQRALVR